MLSYTLINCTDTESWLLKETKMRGDLEDSGWTRDSKTQ